ncbi:MAG: hypothetical protein AAFR76_10180 [Planctomycetota bacterium]
MTDRSGVMIMCDGDLPSLVAVMHTAERLGSTQGPGRVGRLVIVPVARRETARHAAVQRQAALCGAAIESDLGRFDTETDLLLSAGRSADRQGLGEIIWPVHAGVPDDPGTVDLDRASGCAATALLIERLLQVESGDAPTITAPFVDLCDRRLADLAIDLGLIPGDVWWSAGTGDSQSVAAERWGRAFEANGVALRLASASKAASRRG